VSLWVITVHDKELAGEPDVGIAFCEGSLQYAEGFGEGMVLSLRAVAPNGSVRGVGLWRWSHRVTRRRRLPSRRRARITTR